LIKRKKGNNIVIQKIILCTPCVLWIHNTKSVSLHLNSRNL
jgi:hypothetical protein